MNRAGLSLIAWAVTAACVWLALPGSAAAAARGDCANADSTPKDATAKQMSRAVRCLINQERAERDKRELRVDRDLRRVARRHNELMLEEHCFRHRCPGEAPLRERIAKSGYVKDGRFGFGENIGCATTPREMVRAWMGGRLQRRNLLGQRFRHIGVGADRGSPPPPDGVSCRPKRDYATYTVIVGWRRKTG